MRFRIGARSSGVVLSGILILGVWGCASSHHRFFHQRTSNQNTTATANSLAAAGPAYGKAFNTMVQADNAGISQQNSANAATSKAGIDARIKARTTFDTAVRAIHFPPSVQPDVQAVLAADAALERQLGTLAASVGSTSSFNRAFPAVQSAKGKFSAADTTLTNALGLQTTNGGGNTGSGTT